MNSYEQIVERIEINYNRVIDEIKEFSSIYNRPVPTVIAVSKTRSIEEILAAKDCGINHFGENYSKELFDKKSKINGVKWHFIGHLQRGNVKHILNDTILHTLDSKKLVDRLVKMKYLEKTLIQVNISSEKSKSGIPFSLKEISDLVRYSKEKGIKITGLMTIANALWEKEYRTNKFKELFDIGKKLELSDFSYGMSSDWKEAILGGCTILRIGTLIFGERQ